MLSFWRRPLMINSIIRIRWAGITYRWVYHCLISFLTRRIIEISLFSHYIIYLSGLSSVLRLSLSYSCIDDLRTSVSFNFVFAETGTEFFFNSPFVISPFMKNLNTIIDRIRQGIIGYDSIIGGIFSLKLDLTYSF
jgi:hypothetical protein